MTQYLGYFLGIGGTLSAAVVYWLQSRTRVREAQDQAEISKQQEPMAVLRQQLAAKDAEILQTREQFFTFVNAQIARTEAQTKAILDLGAEARANTDAIRALGTSLEAHREESKAGRASIHDELGQVRERLAEIQGHLGAA